MRNTMKIYFLFIILFCQTSFGQSFSCDSLFKRFKDDVEIELLRSQKLDWDSETRESYCTLVKNCSVESLVRYVEDSIPAVRCLMFASLAQKNAGDYLLNNLLLAHKGDTAKYVDSPTDVVISWSVEEYMNAIIKFKTRDKIADRYTCLPNKQRAIQKLPGESHGFISKDSLLLVDCLQCSFNGCKIESFTILTSKLELRTKNIFTKEAKQIIQELTMGDVIVFDDIVVEDLDKVKRRIVSLSLVIK